MFEDILNPVDDNLLKLSNLLPEQVIGKNIFINSKSLGFPDIKDISIGLLKSAQNLLPTVTIDFELRVKISQVCGSLDVDGLRGDIVTNRSARAIAAFEGRTEVQEEDIARVITCSLRHRLRKDPLEQVDSGERAIKAFCKVFNLNEKEDLSKFQLATES